MKALTEQENKDLAFLLKHLSVVDMWVDAVTSEKKLHTWSVQPRSPLSADDSRTNPYRVSHRAQMALSAAVDFLHCLHRSLIQTRDDVIDVRIHSYAQAALIRCAVENACTAIFLLGPGRMERITNRLSLEWNELPGAYRLRELASSTPPSRTRKQREDQLIELLLKAGFTSTPRAGHDPDDEAQRAARAALRDFRYSKMVRRAGELVPAVGADVAESVWRSCSGLAHGDFSATLGFLAEEAFQTADPEVALVQTSMPIRLFVGAGCHAIFLVAAAFDLFRKRATAPKY